MKIIGKRFGEGYLTMDDIKPGDCFIFLNDTDSTEGATIYLKLDYGYCAVSDGAFFDSGNYGFPVQLIECELVLK